MSAGLLRIKSNQYAPQNGVEYIISNGKKIFVLKDNADDIIGNMQTTKDDGPILILQTQKTSDQINLDLPKYHDHGMAMTRLLRAGLIFLDCDQTQPFKIENRDYNENLTDYIETTMLKEKIAKLMIKSKIKRLHGTWA